MSHLPLPLIIVAFAGAGLLMERILLPSITTVAFSITLLFVVIGMMLTFLIAMGVWACIETQNDNKSIRVKAILFIALVVCHCEGTTKQSGQIQAFIQIL